MVTIPLNAIFQVVIDESILFLNPTATVEKFFKQESPAEDEEGSEDQEERSFNAFKMNKKNKDLFD
jgi:hypothetical protein